MRGALSHPRGNDFGGQTGAARRIWAGIGNLGLAEHAAIDANGGLERCWRRLAARAGDPHAVPADLFDLDIGQIEHNVGREIGCRIVDFVEQLLDHC